MKNFLNDGNVLTVPAPADTVSGQFLLVGAALFGSAVGDALSGTDLALKVSGVFTDAPKATGAAWAVGDILYWDDAAKKFTKTSSANTRVGVAVAAAQSGDATGTVKIGPAIG
ncbi:MAG: DUF2190 family protein [Afipia sp.]|nr:DUF2190 family protein [Afipia sp.]